LRGPLAGKPRRPVRRCRYAHSPPHRLRDGWEAKLHPLAIQPIQQFAYTKGKNAIDMCMAIDAMDSPA